jgi:hypothetical protein
MIGRRAAIAVVAAAVVFVLSGCAPAEYVSPISTGTVARKDYFPAHTEERRKCSMIGKIMHCTNYDVDVAAAWQFVIYDAENPSVSGKVPVTEETYNAYEMGDLYPSVRTASPTPEPTSSPEAQR